jgi:AraC family ethanolamine operon transcriptional activator
MGAAAPAITIRNLHGIESLGAADPALPLGLAATLLTPLPPGRPLGALLRAALPGLTVRSGWLQGELRLRGAVSGRHLVLALRLPDTLSEAGPGRLRLWHRHTQPGDLCVLPPGHELDACLHGGLDYALVALRPPVLREALQRGEISLPGLDPLALLERAALYSPPPDIARAAGERVRAALAILQEFGAALSPRAEALLRGELLEALLAPLAAAQGRRRNGPEAQPEPEPVMDATYIVRLVEDYLTVTGAAAGGELPDIDTICTAFRLSRRSLARAFHDSLGIGPMTYIRLLRLSQTRRALVAARQAPSDDEEAPHSVTAIALGHGFTELGRFAVLYRRMFGETPSETLHGGRRAA